MSLKTKRFKIIRKGTENTPRAIKNSSALFGRRRNKIISQMDFKFFFIIETFLEALFCKFLDVKNSGEDTLY
jgi:hypothetical protein